MTELEKVHRGYEMFGYAVAASDRKYRIGDLIPNSDMMIGGVKMPNESGQILEEATSQDFRNWQQVCGFKVTDEEPGKTYLYYKVVIEQCY